jgi:hypothetical protein
VQLLGRAARTLLAQVLSTGGSRWLDSCSKVRQALTSAAGSLDSNASLPLTTGHSLSVSVCVCLTCLVTV